MACTGPAPDERPVLIPAPQKTIWGDGTYRLPERLQLGIADTALIAAAGYVNEVLAPYGTVAVDRATGEISCWNSIRPPCRLKGTACR